MSTWGLKLSKILLPASAVCLLYALSVSGEDKAPAPPVKVTEKGKAAVQRIIFEEQKIEGKIRRPQLVLIKADQRPAFPPMIMQSAGKNENVGSSVDPSVIDNTANQNAFRFQGTAITNYVP